MPRKLKTYVTSSGFFEMAVAAPSMKAALQAWGMGHNTFKQGFAKETEDAAIVSATTAKPGVVLRRAVGSKGAFSEHAELPKSLPAAPSHKPNAAKTAARKSPPPPKEKPRAPASAKKPDPKAERAAMVAFKKEQARREKDDAAEEARIEKERAARLRASEKAEAAIEKAQGEHDAVLARIETERDKLDARAAKEKARWTALRRKLGADRDRARR